jgi:hypothetical protein
MSWYTGCAGKGGKTGFLVVCGLWASGIVNADLIHTQLSDLVKSSDVIARGRIIRAQLNPEGGGTAVVEVLQTYVGRAENRRVTVGWGAPGSHDQSLEHVGEERLLFLKQKNPNTLQETRAGMSYWPLWSECLTGRVVIPYTYPMTEVEIDVPGLVTRAKVCTPDLPDREYVVDVPVISLDVLVPLLLKLSDVKGSEGTK